MTDDVSEFQPFENVLSHERQSTRLVSDRKWVWSVALPVDLVVDRAEDGRLLQGEGGIGEGKRGRRGDERRARTTVD